MMAARRRRVLARVRHGGRGPLGRLDRHRYHSRMVDWDDFAREAPRIAEVFVRRHKATGNLCFLATLRSDGYPRISPMEPTIFEGRLVLVGMSNTTNFRDLGRDPRFSLHTAT